MKLGGMTITLNLTPDLNALPSLSVQRNERRVRRCVKNYTPACQQGESLKLSEQEEKPNEQTEITDI